MKWCVALACDTLHNTHTQCSTILFKHLHAFSTHLLSFDA